MKMNIESVFSWAWGRSVERLRVKSAIMITIRLCNAHDYERRHSKTLEFINLVLLNSVCGIDVMAPGSALSPNTCLAMTSSVSSAAETLETSKG